MTTAQEVLCPSPTALAAFKELLSEEQLLTSKEHLTRYASATFPTVQKIPFVLLPSSTQEVQKIVKIANQYNITLYPVSGGQNWGFGNKVPVADNCAVIDLQRLNRIVEYNEQYSYITVEAGVTFSQLIQFLKEKNSPYFIGMTGGPEHASVIGNTLERGDGIGPIGDRSSAACALQVVLPQGEVITTGFGPFSESSCSPLSKSGLGPSLDGLFTQSNFGIVTQMTFWLRRLPHSFQGVLFTMENDDQMHEVVAGVKKLQEKGIVHPHSFILWNVYKLLISQFPKHPFITQRKSMSAASYHPMQILEELSPFWKKTKWFGYLGVYSESALHAFADKQEIKKTLKPHTNKFFVLSPFSRKVLRILEKPISRLTELNVDKFLKTFYEETICLGNPTRMSLAAVYWRKNKETPQELNPVQDNCGLYWLCHCIPLSGVEISRFNKIIEETSFAYRFEPNIAMINHTERVLRGFNIISYDRDLPEEDERAKECYLVMQEKLNRAGFTSYRVGIQDMERILPDQLPYRELIRRLKGAIDPNNILAPGRYDFKGVKI